MSVCLFFKVALLDSRERTVDYDQLGLVQFAIGGDAFDLTLAEQGGWAHRADRQDVGFGDDEADRQRQPPRLFYSGLRVLLVPSAPDIRAHDQGPRAAGALADFLVEAQADSPPELSSSSHSVVRSTGTAGWMVDTACL